MGQWKCPKSWPVSCEYCTGWQAELQQLILKLEAARHGSRTSNLGLRSPFSDAVSYLATHEALLLKHIELLCGGGHVAAQ